MKNEYLDDRIGKKEYDDRKRLTMQYKASNKLEHRNIGTGKYGNRRNIRMNIRSKRSL